MEIYIHMSPPLDQSYGGAREPHAGRGAHDTAKILPEPSRWIRAVIQQYRSRLRCDGGEAWKTMPRPRWDWKARICSGDGHNDMVSCYMRQYAW